MTPRAPPSGTWPSSRPACCGALRTPSFSPSLLPGGGNLWCLKAARRITPAPALCRASSEGMSPDGELGLLYFVVPVAPGRSRLLSLPLATNRKFRCGAAWDTGQPGTRGESGMGCRCRRQCRCGYDGAATTHAVRHIRRAGCYRGSFTPCPGCATCSITTWPRRTLLCCTSRRATAAALGPPGLAGPSCSAACHAAPGCRCCRPSLTTHAACPLPPRRAPTCQPPTSRAGAKASTCPPPLTPASWCCGGGWRRRRAAAWHGGPMSRRRRAAAAWRRQRRGGRCWGITSTSTQVGVMGRGSGHGPVCVRAGLRV